MKKKTDWEGLIIQIIMPFVMLDLGLFLGYTFLQMAKHFASFP